MNPGNIWRGRADAQQLLVADWQMVKMGPAAIDFFTPLCTTDVDSQRLVSDLPCNIRREGGQSLVIGGPSLVILEGKSV